MERAMKHGLGAVVIGGLVATLSLTSCGGGGDSGTATSPTATSVASSGTITGFGSVFINGIKYEVESGTMISRDGGSSSLGSANLQDIFKVGMVVEASGSSSGTTRTASTIVQEDTVDGPITSAFNPATSRFEVLGIPVIVDDRTKFDTGLSTLDLTPGVSVEVSGFVQPDGSIAAGFIEKKTTTACSSASLCEVKGVVSAHNPGAGTFQIGNLIIDYSTRPLSIDDSMALRCGSLWDNCFVEVKGDSFNNAIPPILIATKVEPDGFDAPDGNQVELEGFVTSTSGTPPISFVLGATTVNVTAGTLYLGGVLGDIAVGQKLEVQGPISGGVITATKVKFQDAVRIESNVLSIPTATSFTVDGLPGITVVVNSQTQFKNVPNDDLAAIPLGSNVRIQGREAAGNSVVATEVELRDTQPDNKVILQGVVQSASAPQLTILGVLIDSTNVSQFRDINDRLIGRSEFFSALKPNTTVVKAKADLSGPSVAWTELELESD